MDNMGATSTKDITVTEVVTETNNTVIPKEKRPQYFYVRENKKNGQNRIITFCYLLDKETNVLKYGATIFKKEKPKDCFCKKTHRKTALERFEKCPVTVNIGKMDLFEKDKWRMNFRKLLFGNGVCEKHH